MANPNCCFIIIAVTFFSPANRRGELWLMKNVGNLHWPIELRILQMPYIEAYMKSVNHVQKKISWRNSLLTTLHQCNLQRYCTGKRLFSFMNSQTTEDKFCHLFMNLWHFFDHSFDIIILSNHKSFIEDEKKLLFLVYCEHI